MPGEAYGPPSATAAPPGRAVAAVAGEGRALTDMQASFVVAYTTANGAIGDATAAAKLAGYKETSAGDLGRRLVGLPHVQAAIREANQQQISGKIATKAIALLDRVIDDESASLKVRVDAARTILDRAGFCALPAGPKRLSEKALAEMTADELRQVMAEARKEMDKARTIDPPAIVVDQAVTVNATTEPERIEQ